MFLFLRFHFAFHHPLDCSAEEVTQSILYILRGLYVVFSINLEMISLLPSVIDGDFLGLPILFSCVFYSIIPQIQGNLQKKVNRLDCRLWLNEVNRQ